MVYLGFDYGLKFLGVALATGPIAEPLTTFPTASAFSEIPQLISHHQATALIVGLPEGPVKPVVLAFISQLQSFSLPIYTVDETLSSADARQSLLHTTRSRRRHQEHAVAAAIILQNWLDNHLISH